MAKFTQLQETDYLLVMHKQQLLSHASIEIPIIQIPHVEKLLVKVLGNANILNEAELIQVGPYADGQCYVFDVFHSTDDSYLVSFRSLMQAMANEEKQLINRAMQLITWRKQHQYCGQCGQKTRLHDEEQAFHCKPCELFYYPRISPCMMCLVTKGDYCLLAQHQKHRNGFYSTLAGFVEAGEEVEATVHREVMEEVSLTVSNLSYYTSQAWPFPHQLMIGYFAEYASGDIVVQDKEIVDAQWFHYSDLPDIPPPETLSGMMIGEFVKQRTKNVK